MEKEVQSVLSEPMKFFRFLMPGVIFFIELFVLFFINEPCKTWGFIETRIIFNSNSGFTTALGGLITSGGIGFLLGTVYYATLNISRSTPFLTCVFYDHLSLVKSAMCSGLIEVHERKTKKCTDSEKPQCLIHSNCKKIESEDIDSKGHAFALHLVTAFHHERGKGEPAFDEFDRIAHIMHGAGTSFIGAIVVWVIFLLSPIVVFETFSCLRYGVAAIIGVAFIILHRHHYSRLVRYYESLFNAAFWRELRKDSSPYDPWIYDTVDTEPPCRPNG